VTFLFVGTEELGLHGSALFLQQNSVEFASFVNIESLGPGLPLVVMQRGNGSLAALRAYAKTPGTVFATLADDVTRFGIIASTSDTIRFRKAGMPGCEALYVGNPTWYHTRKDVAGSASHLQLLGDQLLSLVNNFVDREAKESAIAIGVAPLVVVVKLRTAKLTGTLLCLIGLGICWFKAKKRMLWFIAKYVFANVILGGCLIGGGVLLFFFNSVSYASSIWFSFCFLTFAGFLVVLAFANESKCSKYASILFDSIMMALLRNFDSSILFIWRGFFSLLTLLCPTNLRFVCRTIGSSLIVFAFYIVFRIMTYYTSMVPGLLGEFVPLAIINLFVLTFLIGCFPGSVKVTRMQSLAILFGIFVFLAAKAPPYGDDFALQGTVGHYFNSSNQSSVLFAPGGGKRLLKLIASKLRNGSDIIMDRKFDRPLREAACVLRSLNSSLPSFVAKWPHFEVISNTSEVNRTVRFVVPEVNPGLSHLALLVDCGRRKCITGVRGFEEVKSFEKSDANGFRHVIRVVPAVDPLDIEFNVTAVGPVAAKVCFTWGQWSPQLLQFMDELPPFVLPIGTVRVIGDTTLINETHV
jgi:hypothetical protein